MSRPLFPFLLRSEACIAAADAPTSPESHATLGDVIHQRYGRREVLHGSLAAGAIAALLGPLALSASRPALAAAAGATPQMMASAVASHGFAFREIPHGVDETHHVAEGYDAQVLIRWGDPVLPGAPAFDPLRQSAENQARQFGYNNDFVGYLPLPQGSRNATHGLLCVNHEYTDEELMFPGLGRPQERKEINFAGMTEALVNIEMAAHGMSVVEIRREDGRWRTVADSRYNRRITGSGTPCRLTGPAAGHPRLRTAADPQGTTVIGTLNNCAGGVTPWGTVLSGEENIDGYFWGTLDENHPERANYKRMGIPGAWYAWGKFHDRFDIAKEPREANRFGWMVEIDPYDPDAPPKKRTALGRFKHEGANVILAADGRAVVYCGDDQRFDYVYRFVSRDRFNPDDRAANLDLLDHGVLSVARYHPDGSGEWLPLIHGQGPLTASNGFADQGDVVIACRLAADLLGATRMDRPEDVEPNPRTGKVYVMLTNNAKRTADAVDAANPRPENHWGHVVEMTPDNGDHTAQRFRWDILLKAGNPALAAVGAEFHAATSADGWFACPDNCAFDNAGNLWIATDQGENWKKASGAADGIWAVETEGPLRGYSKAFFRVPVGAEMCGPFFTPDDETLFVAVQHPSADGTDQYPPFGRASSFEDPATRWPDFDPAMPPRPSIVAITRKGGGRIGT